MKYQYITRGTCSRAIDIEVEDGIVKNVSFQGGCHGNTHGVAELVKGMTPAQVVERLEGIMCGNKGTSCPDQLARALREMGAVD